MNLNSVGSVALALGVCAVSDCRAQFQPGDIITHTQSDWGEAGTAAGTLLSGNFNILYGQLGYVEVGIAGAGGHSMIFTSAGAVFTYLPASGAAGPLNADLADPTSSASGVFGGEVLALRFNVDFPDAGLMLGALGVPFGDLVIHDYASLPQTNGLSVRQVLDQANVVLGGGVAGYNAASANILVGNLNASFAGGTPSPFAQGHLRMPCYPDCNGDGALTVADFGCFQTRFVAADPYADCNGDGVRTVADFGCFQTAFVAGCP